MYKSYLSSDRTEDNLVKAAPLVQDDFIPEGLRVFPNGLFWHVTWHDLAA